MAHRRIALGSSRVHPGLTNRLPAEILSEIFKVYAASNPQLLDQRVVDLRLVGRFWNTIANDTPQLWTKINLSFPFADDHRAVASERIRASRTEKIDVSIDFRDPNWNGEEHPHDGIGSRAANKSIWVNNVTTVLLGTETRWRSIVVKSDTWLPLFKLMEAWNCTNLPSLESISMERANTEFGMHRVRFSPQMFVGPMTLFGQRALLPRLRDLSLSAVHVDWDDLCVGFRNLRKLELKNQTNDVGPSFEQFAAMLSSSPQLEHLDIFGFCPEHHTRPAFPVGGDPEAPVVHLPALKVLIFGWKNVDLGCTFLEMFQIGSSLESLTLLDTESGLGDWRDPRGRCWHQSSEEIFEVLNVLGKAAPKDEDELPPVPFISMCGVKRLEIIWTKTTPEALVRFLRMLTELKHVRLEDVDRSVLESVSRIWGSRVTTNRWLRRVDLEWKWQKGIPSFAGGPILDLNNVGIEVSVQTEE